MLLEAILSFSRTLKKAGLCLGPDGLWELRAEIPIKDILYMHKERGVVLFGFGHTFSHSLSLGAGPGFSLMLWEHLYRSQSQS